MKIKRFFLIFLSCLIGLLSLDTGVFWAKENTVNPMKPQTSVGTGFSYQGLFRDNGELAEGTFDFQFQIYDSEEDGTLLGTVTKDDENISDGIIAVQLDFGDVFDGDARWLAVSVRPGAETGAYTPLTPRQALTPAPYALHALDAGTLGGLGSGSFWQLGGNSGSTPGTDYLGTTDNQDLVMKTNNVEQLRLDTDGNLGLGENDPDERLTVGGNTHILGEDNPVPLVYTNTNLSSPLSLYVLGDYAYTANYGNNRLVIYDVSDPNNIIAKDYTDTNLSGTRSVYVSGRYAYVVSATNDRLVIFDVSDVDNIVAKDYTSAYLDGPTSVYVTGCYAYVTDNSNSRLVIYDVSDPDNIVVRDYTSDNLNSPKSVFVSGIYAYVVSSSNDRLAIFDVSDPDNIVAKGYTSTNLDFPVNVYVTGRYAYVVSIFDNHLAIFDVSDPDNIVAKDYSDTNLGYPRDVYVSGGYAYVASLDYNRLVIFDVSDPDNITPLGSTNTNLDGPQSVHVSGRYAYVASQNNNRLVIFELNHLEAPTLEVGNLHAGDLQVSANAQVSNNLNVGGGLNVGPGGAYFDGGVAIHGGTISDTLKVVGGYIQFPTISGAAPSATDCDEAKEAGRMVVRTDTGGLYICTGVGGWVVK